MKFNNETGVAELTNEEINILSHYIKGISESIGDKEVESLDLSIPFSKAAIDYTKNYINTITKNEKLTEDLLNVILTNIIIVSFSYLADFSHCSLLSESTTANSEVRQAASSKLQMIINNMNFFKSENENTQIQPIKKEDLN